MKIIGILALRLKLSETGIYLSVCMCTVMSWRDDIMIIKAICAYITL
jgi:hypothetical protein